MPSPDVIPGAHLFAIIHSSAREQLTKLPIVVAPKPPDLAHRKDGFITEFAKDGRNTYGTFSQWDQPADPARGLKQAIEAIKFEITVLAWKPTHLALHLPRHHVQRPR